MPKASRYEREFLHLISKDALVGRFAGSGSINTIVGDLVFIPPLGAEDPRPAIVEVKYTTRSVYYPSANVKLLADLSRRYNYRPILAVRFKGAGWVVVDLSDGVPRKVTSDAARFYKVGELTL